MRKSFMFGFFIVSSAEATLLLTIFYPHINRRVLCNRGAKWHCLFLASFPALGLKDESESYMNQQKSSQVH